LFRANRSGQARTEQNAFADRGHVARQFCLHGRNSPCRDELNVYHFTEIPANPDSFSVTASKIVDGKEIVMGTSEWRYDTQKHVLEGETPGGTFRFTIETNKMEGSLTTKDSVAYRRIHLKKDH
jgi:hypothetical protein